MRGWIVAGLVCVAGSAAAEPVEGRVVDVESGDPLAGATIVAAGRAEITGDDGRFSIDAPPGPVMITVYFADVEVRRSLTVRAGSTSVVADIAVDASAEIIGCLLGPYVPPLIDFAAPMRGTEVGREDVVLSRGHVVDDLAGLWPVTGPVGGVERRIGGARLMRGAPALSLALIDRAVLTSRAGRDGAPAAAATLEVEVPSGNEGRARSVRGALLRGEGGAKMVEVAGVMTGELSSRSRYTAGADLRGDGDRVAGQAMARLDVDGRRSDGTVVALVTTRAWPATIAPPLAAGAPAAATSRMVAPGRGAGLGHAWLDASGHMALPPTTLGQTWQLGAGVTAESLWDGPPDTAPSTRVAGRATLSDDMIQAAGWHELELGVEAGAGDSPDGATRDGAAWARDHWELERKLHVGVGIRADHRSRGEHTAAVVAPHLSLEWTGLETASLFADVSRRADLDAEVRGEASPRATDALAGGQIALIDGLTVGSAWRTSQLADRTRHAGLAWATVQPGRALRGVVVRIGWEAPVDDDESPTAVGTLLYRRYGSSWHGAAAVHLAEDVTTAGAALGWTTSLGSEYEDTPALQLRLEGFTGRNAASSPAAARLSGGLVW